MPVPGVSINVTNGNLKPEINVQDCVPGLLVSVNTEALVAKVMKIYSLDDAVAAGITETAEPLAYKQVKEYYEELGGKQLLYFFGIGKNMTKAEGLSATEANGVQKLLMAASGEITLIGIVTNKSANAGDKFLDADVEAAALAFKSTAQAWQKKNYPVRAIIEGLVANESADNTFKPNTASNGFCGVLLGDTENGGHACVGVALARAAKYECSQKIGAGSAGALSITTAYIGSQKVEDVVNLDQLHDDGFLVLMKRPGAAGYYFGRDNMCSNDDYKILAHGRVMDKAQRIAAKAYLPFIEEKVRVLKDGTIDPADATYIEATLLAAIKAAMSEQISDVDVKMPLDQDVINTDTTGVNVRILPLGYSTWIEVSMGFASSL